MSGTHGLHHRAPRRLPGVRSPVQGLGAPGAGHMGSSPRFRPSTRPRWHRSQRRNPESPTEVTSQLDRVWVYRSRQSGRVGRRHRPRGRGCSREWVLIPAHATSGRRSAAANPGPENSCLAHAEFADRLEWCTVVGELDVGGRQALDDALERRELRASYEQALGRMPPLRGGISRHKRRGGKRLHELPVDVGAVSRHP